MGPSQVTFRIAVSLDLFSISPILPNVFEFNETIIILEASTPFHSKPHNFQLISFTGIKSFYNDFVSSESFLWSRFLSFLTILGYTNNVYTDSFFLRTVRLFNCCLYIAFLWAMTWLDNMAAPKPTLHHWRVSFNKYS